MKHFMWSCPEWGMHNYYLQSESREEFLKTIKRAGPNPQIHWYPEPFNESHVVIHEELENEYVK